MEIVVAGNYGCGEGPLWDAEVSRLLWNDAAAAKVFQYQTAGGETSTLVDGLEVSGIALHRDGGLVLAGADGLYLWHDAANYDLIVTHFEEEKLFFNDILADAHGRLYAGTLYWGEAGMEKRGKLFLIDTDRGITVVDDGIELANGLGLSPDGGTLYFADSAARTIYAYDVAADGALRNKRVFVAVPPDEGIPDGLTVDALGHVWSAQWYGGQVVRYDPEGTVVQRLAFPTQQVSSLAFGGADLSDLYVTSAGEPWPSPLTPSGFVPTPSDTDGSLFRVRVPVQGKPEYRADILR